MPRDEELQWIDLIDFSAGIHSNNHLAGGVQVTATNPAMASPTNTYRCRSLPSGGLGPLPRMKESFELTTPPTGAITPTDTFIINGLGTLGQVFGDPTNSDHRIEVHLVVSYLTAGTPNVHTAKWLREHIYDTTPTTETIYTDTDALAGAISYQYAYFLKTRMNPAASVANPGKIVMVCVYSPPAGNLQINRVMPDPATPGTTSTVQLIAGDTDLYHKAVAHQGRIVVGKFVEESRGLDTTLSSNENILYTDVNTYGTSLTTPQVYVPEVDPSISVMMSMTANQLVVVKAAGGGYVVQGDMDDPTIVRLPNLMSPDGTITAQGTQTPRGFVYSAGDRGIYIWNGGDQSEPLSNQIDAKAFSDTLEGAGHAGQMDRWLDLLLVPNLWVCDLETRGWWRLDDPTAYPTGMAFFSSAKYGGQMISARQQFVSSAVDGNEKAFYLWEYDDLAYTWSWQSQPLWATRGHYIETRQCVAAISGHGTVTITLSDDSGGTTDAHVLTIDSDVIRNFRFNTAMSAENLTIRIQASGNNGGGVGTYEAPLLHRLFVGYREDSHLALTDT